MVMERVLLVISALLVMASLLTYTTSSLLLYSWLKRLGERPYFPMLSVPGYLVLCCKRASGALDEGSGQSRFYGASGEGVTSFGASKTPSMKEAPHVAIF